MSQDKVTIFDIGQKIADLEILLHTLKKNISNFNNYLDELSSAFSEFIESTDEEVRYKEEMDTETEDASTRTLIQKENSEGQSKTEQEVNVIATQKSITQQTQKEN